MTDEIESGEVLGGQQDNDVLQKVLDETDFTAKIHDALTNPPQEGETPLQVVHSVYDKADDQLINDLMEKYGRLRGREVPLHRSMIETLKKSLLENQESLDHIFSTENGSFYFVKNGQAIRLKAHAPQADEQDPDYTVEPVMQIYFITTEQRDAIAKTLPAMDNFAGFLRQTEGRIQVGDLAAGMHPLEFKANEVGNVDPEAGSELDHGSQWKGYVRDHRQNGKNEIQIVPPVNEDNKFLVQTHLGRSVTNIIK